MKFQIKHGGYGTRLYNIWRGMKTRCHNPNDKDYPHYGGKGITVCSEWADDFACFQRWALKNGYERHLTIDRIDNDSGYLPSNCEWITNGKNAIKRSFVKLDYKRAQAIKKLVETGISQRMIADACGISQSTVSRIATGIIWRS